MRRVAVTGAGVVSPVGCTVRQFWAALLEGRRAFQPIPDGQPLTGNRLWAAVPDSFIDPVKPFDAVVRNADRFTQYAVVAATEAVITSGLDKPPPRTAVVLGNTMGGLPLFARTQSEFVDHPHRVTPKLMALVIPNMAAGRLSLNWGLHGRQLTISTACASSLDAIGVAARMIESGEVDYALAGGTETLLAPVVYESLERAGALSRSLDTDRASRPFDIARDGFVMSDGAGIVLLESMERAEARQARVLARVRGYGSLADAYHLTAPEPTGRYEAEAIQAALDEAGCDVGVVFAHATGTVMGDLAELRAINAVFARRPPVVTALRGHLGHAMAAAGAMSVVAGILALDSRTVPPTLGTRDVEPEAEFDLVLETPRELEFDEFCVNAFGFGGQNASIVLSR